MSHFFLQDLAECKGGTEKPNISFYNPNTIGKGSHTLSGKDGNDADRYQEKDVRNALRDIDQQNEGEHP